MPFVQLKGKILSYDEIDTGKRNKLLVAHFQTATVWQTSSGIAAPNTS